MENQTIRELMDQAGCSESVLLVLDETTGKKGHRMRFADEFAALVHRKRVGCGGWVLGPYLFAGTEWTPSLVMLHASGQEGVLR